MPKNEREFKNKQELVDFIKHQTNIELRNDDHTFNKKRKFLYTHIDMRSKYSILPLLHKYGIKYETHINDNYWIRVN